MLISKLFQINIEKVYFKVDRIVGYDVCLFSEELQDFEVIHLNYDSTCFPFGLTIDELSLPLGWYELVSENYPDMRAFIQELITYVGKSLIENE